MHVAEDKKEFLESLMLARSLPPTQYQCSDCEDSGFVFVGEFRDGTKTRTRKMYHKYLIDSGKRISEIVQGYYVEPCTNCEKEEEDRFFHAKSRKRNEIPVKLELIETKLSDISLSRFKVDPIKTARAIPQASTILVGDTGRFKTLIAEYWFNRLLHENFKKSSELIWLTENEIFFQAREDNCRILIKRLKKKKIIFIDELFFPAHWQGMETEEKLNHNRKLEMEGFHDLIEWLYINQESLLVVATSNYTPEEAVKSERYTMLLRRIDEIFRGEAGRIEI